MVIEDQVINNMTKDGHYLQFNGMRITTAKDLMELIQTLNEDNQRLQRELLEEKVHCQRLEKALIDERNRTNRKLIALRRAATKFKVIIQKHIDEEL